MSSSSSSISLFEHRARGILYLALQKRVLSEENIFEISDALENLIDDFAEDYETINPFETMYTQLRDMAEQIVIESHTTSSSDRKRLHVQQIFWQLRYALFGPQTTDILPLEKIMNSADRNVAAQANSLLFSLTKLTNKSRSCVYPQQITDFYAAQLGNIGNHDLFPIIVAALEEGNFRIQRLLSTFNDKPYYIITAPEGANLPYYRQYKAVAWTEPSLDTILNLTSY